MSSTINIQQSVLWSGAFIRFQPQTIGGMEPAMSNANIIKQTIMGAPFRWPWNRVEAAPIALIAGTQDYTAALPDFGFIEKAWLTIGSVVVEITVKNGLSKDSSSDRPEFVSVQSDDGAGNITFRLMPQPDQAYTLTIMYQRKASLITSLASRWNPIPDELSYVYNVGFLALGMMLVGDARFPIFNDRFVAHLLGASDGLDETQRNLFIGVWMDYTNQLQRSQAKAAQGTAARLK